MAGPRALRVDGQGDDEAAYLLPYTETLARESALDGLSKRLEPTPDPAPDEDEETHGGGIVRRANEFRSQLGPIALESIGLQGMEIAKAVGKRADELYRNEFPRLEPRFTRTCTECAAEFDEEIAACEECGAPTREPSQEQKTHAEQFFEQVNKEGQSLTELYKFLARDGGRLGVWLHIVKKRYAILDGRVFETVEELVRGDPKRIKPVVDANGRIGGHWWACPVHRDASDLATEPGQCEVCGADLREVFFAEVDTLRADDPEKVFFADEVITHAPFEPRLAGLDGLSPIAGGVWLKQAILRWMDLYAAGFYDQNNTNRYPGKLILLHTSNKQAIEKQLAQAQDEADDDPYAQGIVYNEVPPGMDQSADKAQVLDMMSDQLRGQSAEIRQDYKSDIRSVYGLTDAQDSELEDAGGLNNEGLQLEINDRDKAAAHQELRSGPLQKLMDVLGFDDWEITFVPPQREENELSTLDKIRAASMAEQNGISYQIEDGRVSLVDTDGPVEPEPTSDDAAVGGGDDPPTDVRPPDVDENLDQEARGHRRAGASAAQALHTLERMHRELCWPAAVVDGELTQAAREPFFADDEDMPQFVAELIEEALRSGPVYLGEYDAPNVTGQAVKSFFREKLDQPQGWSIESLARDFAERFKLDFEEAVGALRTQLTSVLNEAREQGYRRQGDLDDRRFKWLGPDDDDNTEACEWLRRQTNPDYGGEPRPLDELKALVEEANDRFVPSHDNREWLPHINCRHTYVEHFD